MRRIVLSILLLMNLLGTKAQDIYYEMWIDNYRPGIRSGMLSEGEQTITIDATVIPSAGLHFLNIIPFNDDGEQGVWSRIAFLMPEGWPEDTEGKYVEYWIDDNRQLGARKSYVCGEQQFSFDISNMTYGLHFLSYRTFNAKGEAGAWSRIAFYISNHAFDREPMSYQYWIDKGEKCNGSGYTPGEIPFAVDIEGLSAGKHTFYYRVCYSDDPNDAAATFGETTSVAFEITVVKGDVNSDGAVNAADIMAIMNFISGYAGGITLEQADVNGDGVVNIADIIAVSNIIAGK